MSCAICGGRCAEVIDFGLMPVANAFRAPDDTSTEERFRLTVVACTRCSMVQLTDPVPAEKLFPAGYAFHSSTSARMAEHFRVFARSVIAEAANAPGSFVVELGCNDGILLKHIAAEGIRHVGVEPAENVAKLARANGVTTASRFFDESFARELRDTQGEARVIVGANVLCHIADIRSAIAGVNSLLANDGVCMFEDPYLGDIIELGAFDQMYDEHVYYFSLTSLQSLFEAFDLEVVDATAQLVHGGSMRYSIARRGRRPVHPRVQVLLESESKSGLTTTRTMAEFRSRVEAKRAALTALLERERHDGRRIVGYGATSKSTTTITYCGLSRNTIEYISDTTPGKIGKVSPGAHIPIHPHESFAADRPECALLFAWNHREEIVSGERAFLERGGRFITYVPDVGFISR